MNTKHAIEMGQLQAAPRTAHRYLAISTRLHQSGVMLLKAWLMWVLLAMLLATTCKSADFVIVVDVSGSMSETISRHDKRVRITIVQDALRQYLPALPSGSRVDLIAFNNGIVSEQEVVLNTERDVAAALSWSDGLSKKVGNNTHLWTTLRHALGTAARYSKENPEQPVTVRVLTDGDDNERATTLDKVLQEFQPVLDGEKIRSNLVLLGDLEFKTKLTLPGGAFEVTKNPTWEVIFPPIVLWAPTEPKIGDEVRLFENTTKSVYKDYQWQVDGVPAGQEKVLVWRFKEPRTHRITLKVIGLQGTQNSSTIHLRINEPDKLAVDFVPSTTQPSPDEEVRFIGRCPGKDVHFTWFVNSNQVATSQDLVFRFAKEGTQEIRLTAHNAAGGAGVKVQTFVVKEPRLTASIRGPAETITGRAAQFAGEIAGTCASATWDFGDGTTSVERNPQHTFLCEGLEHKDYKVTLQAISPSGKATQANAHTVRVWAEKKVPAPQAAFRVLTQRPRVGDPIQVVDESVGPVENVLWDVDGDTKASARNPEFMLGTPGTKTIRMTVRGPGGESVATRKIVVVPRFVQPTVWCGASPLSGTAPLTVQFTNRVTGDYRQLVWAFGDGQSSTNVNPVHSFRAATNCTVLLTVCPMDGSQPDVIKQLQVIVTKPWPVWAKATAMVIPALLLVISVATAVYRRRRTALRLPVYYWPEQSPVCKIAMMTEIGQVIRLSPDVHLRVSRDGGSRNPFAEPLEGATLINSDGQEVPSISVGDGTRVTVRDANGVTHTVAISARQKPTRPVTDVLPAQLPGATDICGLLNQPEAAPQPTSSEELDWGWNKQE